MRKSRTTNSHGQCGLDNAGHCKKKPVFNYLFVVIIWVEDNTSSLNLCITYLCQPNECLDEKFHTHEWYFNVRFFWYRYFYPGNG